MKNNHPNRSKYLDVSQGYPALDAHKIKCARRACKWIGKETDWNKNAGDVFYKAACPLCGCTSYRFLKEMVEK